MSRDEEEALLLSVKMGIPGAEGRLIEAYRRLVINIAKVERNRAFDRIPMDTLVLAGESGLVGAAQRFDPAKGFRISTYATHWIRRAMHDQIRTA